MITLNERSGIAIQEIYPLIAGVGIGMLFHTPFQVITNALPKRDLAQATGAFFLVRFMGTTTGLVSHMDFKFPGVSLTVPLHIDSR